VWFLQQVDKSKNNLNLGRSRFELTNKNTFGDFKQQVSDKKDLLF
jgi:hypothetical protein